MRNEKIFYFVNFNNLRHSNQIMTSRILQPLPVTGGITTPSKKSIQQAFVYPRSQPKTVSELRSGVHRAARINSIRTKK